MIIRPATKSDYSQLTLINDKKTEDVFKQRLKEMEENKVVYLVADERGEVVGHVLLKYYGLPHIPEYPVIEDLAVRLDQRKKGIGSALIKKCEELAKEKGFGKIGIQVNPDRNCPVRIVYEKKSFVDVGNKPYVDGTYDGTEDWVIDMVKNI